MLMPLPFTWCSSTRLHVLLSTLLLMTLLSPVRSGLSSAVNHCLNLSGTCRRNNCKPTEDILGSCKRRWKCCRQWWIMLPIPTPVVYSEYQDPLKNKIK
ncbi:beta-defensin 109-like [Vicugna pacos]|uniref:Beta-defensin 109-like n=1 Tax=Vicugna pacos TaxID=30538 RepID=A0ABM5CDJ5_VICPA